MTRDLPGFLDEPRKAVSAPATEPVKSDPQPLTDRPVLFDALPDAPRQIGGDWRPEPVKPGRSRLRSGSIIAIGIAVVIVGWFVTSLGLSVMSSYRASPMLGSLALAAYAAGGSLVAVALASELRALRSLRQVDLMRSLLQNSSVGLEEIRAACIAWLQTVAGRIAIDPSVSVAIQGAESREQIVSLLRNRLTNPLEEESRRIGRKVATEGSFLVAISPHESWDGVIVALYGFRIIRQIATAHGLRPSSLVTAMLLRRTVQLALEVAAVQFITQSLTSNILEHTPLLGHLAKAVPGLAAAELRLYRLAIVSGRACNPLAE